MVEIKVLIPLVSSFIGAILGSYFALSKFKKEKIWDEKRELYSKVIIALEDISYWAEQTRAKHCCEYSNSTLSNVNESLREIQKLSVSGRLVMNQRFHDLLVQVNNELNKECFNAHENWQENSDNPYSDFNFRHAVSVKEIISGYLPKLIDIAKSELPKRT